MRWSTARASPENEVLLKIALLFSNQKKLCFVSYDFRFFFAMEYIPTLSEGVSVEFLLISSRNGR